MGRGPVLTVRIVAVLAMVAASVAALMPPAPAGAQEVGPQLTLSPASDIDPLGQQVGVTASGFQPAAGYYAGTCLKSRPLDFSNLQSLLDACDVQANGVTNNGAPFSADFDLTAAEAARCYPDLCNVAVGTYNGLFQFAEVAATPLEFAPAPPPPPNDPNFAFAASPDAGLDDGETVSVSVTNRNPATATARVYLCPAGLGGGPASQLNICDSLASTTGSDDWSFDLDVPRFINEPQLTRVDCALEPCELFYDGQGEGVVQISEQSAIAIGLAGTPVFTASQTADIRIGDVVTVEWDGYREAPDPALEVVHFVGVCPTVSRIPNLAFERDCAGSAVAASSGTTQLELPASFTSGFTPRTIDCTSSAGRCSVVYASYYITATGIRRQLHWEYRPLSYASKVIINDGSLTADVGDAVSVVGIDQPTAEGAVAFAMVCVVTGSNPLALACSSDVGTIETSFDGDFDGTVVLPATFEANGRTYSCDVVCVPVFAVIGPNFELLAGSGRPLFTG